MPLTSAATMCFNSLGHGLTDRKTVLNVVDNRGQEIGGGWFKTV